jgi:hypothetical protein
LWKSDQQIEDVMVGEGEIMTSPAKVAANRTNATKSTGPRTTQGKSRASRNALRHGLTSAASLSSAVSARVQKMVEMIAGPNATPEQYEQALIIAESEIQLLNIRAAKASAFERMQTFAAHAPSHQTRLAMLQLMLMISPLSARNLPGAPTAEYWTRAYRRLLEGDVLLHARRLKKAARVLRGAKSTPSPPLMPMVSRGNCWNRTGWSVRPSFTKRQNYGAWRPPIATR